MTMKIELWGYEIASAVGKYLEEKYGISDECYIEDMYVEQDNDSEIMETMNLYQYKQDQEWDNNKGKWVVDNEYELDGVYLKRKKKGGKKSEYIKLKKNDCKDASINEEKGKMVLWIMDKEGY